jgi:serine/threonine protein kinase
MRPLGAADPKTIGPYQLLGVLGSGGMGRVYLGASRTGRRVAIKVIRPDLAEDPIFRDRFAREVAAAGRVSPLFTALVVDSDTEAAAPWLATTYIEGVSLDRRVLDDGAMSIEDVLSLAAGLGEALTSIHTVGLVHRDLKPSNILLNDSGPHIIDFGLALGSEQTRLTTSRVVGTPAYMAPERLRGEAAGPPSDVFSLGATLVFAATGRDLVDDASVYEQVLQIAEGRFTLNDVPARLRGLVVRCVSFQPEDRPTAAELTRFVVALGAVTPGLGVEDVTIKISTKHRAEARAAGLPVRTTPRRNGDPESLPTDDRPADEAAPEGWPEQSWTAEGLDDVDTPVASAPAAVSGAGNSGSAASGASTSGAAASTFGSSAFGGPPPDPTVPGTARSGRLRAVIAPRSSSEGHSAAVRMAWTPAVGSAAPGSMTAVPAAVGPVAGGPPGPGTSYGAGTVGVDPGDEWRAPHPSDPNFNGPPFDLEPPRTGWSRRKLITAGGAAAAVVATGGVLAAVELTARQRPGSVTANDPPVAFTPGPGATSTPPVPTTGPVAAGDVLWHASSGAGPLGNQGQNLPGGQRVLVSPSGVIVALHNQNRKVVALTGARKVLWQRTLVSSDAAMWFWGNGVLVADGAWLMLYDLAKGAQKFRHRASDLAARAIGPNHGAIRVTGVALNATTAFIGVGSAILAINRAGNVVSTMRVGNRLTETPETPTAASANWVVTQTIGLQSFVDLYRVGSKNPTWESLPYTPLGFSPNGGPDDGPATVGTDDPATRLVEARIIGGSIVARSERDVRAFSIADSLVQWHELESGPVHAMAAINSSVLVASTSLTKYDTTAGNVQWRVPLAAIRVAVLSQPSQPTVIVAATAGGVVGLEAHGRTVWTAHLPVDLPSTTPTGVTIGPHVAYVTFQLPEGAAAGTHDVVAIALDDKVHR